MSTISPFRSLNSKQYKNATYRIAGLRCSSSATGNLFVDGLSSSSLYTITPHHSKGSIIPLPVDVEKYTTVSPPVVQAHPGQDISDLAISPHAPNVFASIAKDDSLRVFELPAAGVLERNIAQATVELTGLTGGGIVGMTSLAWHPTTRGLLAIGGKDTISIVNVDYDTFGKSASLPAEPAVAKIVLQIRTNQGAGKDISKISWSHNGQFITAIGKDGGLYVIDPRQVKDTSIPITSFTGLLGELKNPHFATFIGKNCYDKVLVIGLGHARKPGYAVLNINVATQEAKVSIQGELNCSSGQLLAHFDYDSQLVYVAPRSAQAVVVYDTSTLALPTPNKTFFIPLISVPIPSGTKAIAPVPKSRLNLMDSEVINFYSLSTEHVEYFSLTAIRKARGFYPELYPDTFAGEAALQLSEYLANNNINPPVVALKQ